MTDRLDSDKVAVFSDIIHNLYSDISLPGVWDEIFRLVQRVIPADGATFRRFDPDTNTVLDFLAIDTESASIEAYTDYYYGANPVLPLAMQRGMRVFRPEDIIPRDVFMSSEYFVDYVLRYNRPPKALVTAMGTGAECRAQFVLGRDKSYSDYTDEDVKYMQLLEPHFSRALYEASCQQELEKVEKALSLGIDNLPSAVFIFDKSCKLVHANQSAKSICDEPLSHPVGLFSMVCSAALDLIANPDICITTANRSTLEIIAGNQEYRLERFLSDTLEYCCINLVDRKADLRATVAKMCRRCGLSAREEEICLLLIKGSSNRDIAGTLGISLYTVKDHVKSIFSKLEVSNKNEILQRAIHI